MRVFMLGWEFPPFISGGLGTACHGLTKAMSELGIDITFVLPTHVDSEFSTHVRMLSPKDAKSYSEISYELPEEFKNVDFRTIATSLPGPYSTPEQYNELIEQYIKNKKLIVNRNEYHNPEDNENGNAGYGGDMFAEIHRYARSAVRLAMQESFDIVHAHDWMTYPAGIAAAYATGKPLVVHIHSTEFDRSGEHVNQGIYDIERHGFHAADKVIAVSHLTRNILISRYGVTGDKIEVVYNGVVQNGCSFNPEKAAIKSDEKIVLFLGRITMQKGPEYFLMAAKKVLEKMDNVKFVVAGSGDMMRRTIEQAAGLGIGNKVLFTGFLRGADVERVYKMADLYVMPSVSEPFGIAPLEALNNDVPVLISKQSGVSEVLSHVLKVDFWDVNEMANKIIAVLKYPPLSLTLRQHGTFEVRKLRWEDAAKKCLKIYNQTAAKVHS